ncbi:MAG: response regulator, partial [Planctomycetales bacterium]|nr:response regulator [Planctomycetales bacterium]
AVTDTRQAMRALETAVDESPFELLLTDLNMPHEDGLQFVERLRADSRFSGLPILMITSSLRPGQTDIARRLGVFGPLLKPVKQSDLLESIHELLQVESTVDEAEGRRAAGRETTGSLAEPVSGATEQGSADPLSEPLEILLVEDNVVNQKLARTLLEKDGHQVSIANHGAEALDWIERRTFDLVLMDIQMPEMDGFTATRKVRERELALGTRTAIVGLTAHAMAGDRQRCLDAGMDDYVTKPIRLPELRRVLTRVHAGELSTPQVHSEQRGGAEVPVDWEAAMETVGGDQRFLRELVDLFELDSQKLLNELVSSVREANESEANRTAHSLKGALTHLGCRAAAEVAWEIEQRAAQGKLTELESRVETLRQLVLESLERLHKLLGQSL